MKLVPNKRVPDFYDSFVQAAIEQSSVGQRFETDFEIACVPMYCMTQEAKVKLREHLAQIPTFGKKREFEQMCNVQLSWQNFTMGLIYPWSGEETKIAKSLPEAVFNGDRGEIYTQAHVDLLIERLEKFIEGRFVFKNQLVQPMPFAARIDAIRNFMEAQPYLLIPVEGASLRPVDAEDDLIFAEEDAVYERCVNRELWGKGPINVTHQPD